MQGFSLERLKKRIMVQIRSLFNNWGLKIVSLIVAIFLWLFVTNYQDPETVLTVNNVPVKLLHTEAVKSEGKIYIVLDDSDTIPVVTINAPRSIVDKLEADNVIATADLEDMNPDYTVPITITTNKYSDSITNISGSIRSVSLSVEDEAKAIFPIEASVVGNAADGYAVPPVLDLVRALAGAAPDDGEPAGRAEGTSTTGLQSHLDAVVAVGHTSGRALLHGLATALHHAALHHAALRHAGPRHAALHHAGPRHADPRHAAREAGDAPAPPHTRSLVVAPAATPTRGPL